MIKLVVMPTPEGHDHHRIKFILSGSTIGLPIGSGFISKRDDTVIGLENCPKCGKENYAASVLDGICAWCGFNIHEQGGIEKITQEEFELDLKETK